ncbi:MAG: hypothetical protein ACRD3L_06305 [Terriglobales bacterium]
MKKFALCLSVLALAVALVPQSQAATKCIHFTNFCDSLSLNTASVGGVMGTAAYGGWDWLCTGNWSDASIIGNATSPARLGTRPYSVAYAYLDAYTFAFTFNAGSHLFDLYGTNASSLLTFPTAQPWTITNGACGANDAKSGRPRMSARR